MAYYLQNTWKSIQRTKNEWFKLLLMILLLTSSISAISQQSEPLKHHYKVAYRPQFEPYEFTNTQNKPDGFTPNLLLEIGKATGITFEFIPLTARETVVALEKSEVDLAGMLYSPERAKQFDFSNSYGHVSDAIFQQVGNKNYITLNSLTGHTIGFVENDRLLDSFATRTDFNKHILVSKLDGFFHLNSSKIDAFFCEEQSGINIISEYDLHNIKLATGDLYPQKYAFATRKGNLPLIQLLNKQIANLHASGKLQKLNDKWLSRKIPTLSWIKKNETVLITALSLFGGFIILLLFWNWMLRRSVNEKTKSIKESESRYSTFFENMGEGVGILDKDEVFVFVNPTAEKIFGVGKGELLGTSLNNFLHGDSFEKNKNETQKRSQGESSVYEQEIVLQDGSKKVILITATPNFVDEKFVGAFGIFRDITERKLVEEALRESEIKYRELVDNSPDAIAIYVEGKIVFVNNECVRLMAATSAEELIGKSVIEFVHPDYRALVIERMKKAVAERVIFILPLTEEKFIRLDGTEIDVEVKAMSVQLENESAVQLIVRDITERKQVELALKNSMSLTEATLESIHHGILAVSQEGTIIKSNAKFAEMWRISSDIMASGDDKTIMESILDQLIDPDEFVNIVSELYKKPEIDSSDLIYFKDGRIFERISTPMYIGGEPTGRVWSFLDVTERIQMEDLLNKNREEFKDLFDKAPIGYHEIDTEGRIVRINETECEMLGYTAEELIGKHFWATIAEENISRKAIEDKLTGKIVPLDFFEREFRKKDGTMVSVLLKDKLLKNKDGDIIGIRTTVQDINERKLAEEAIKNERLLLRTVIDNIPYTIYAKDLAGRKTLANKAEANFLGAKSEDEVLGKDDFDFYPKEIAEKFLADDQLMIQIGLPDINKESSEFDANGKEHWLLSSKLPFYNKDNQIIGLVGITHDITYRKHAEEILQNERLLLRTVIDNIPNTIYAKDLAGRKTLANKAELNFLNAKSEDEVLGKDDFEFYPKEIAERFLKDDQLMIQTGLPEIDNERFEFDVKGKEHWLLSSKLPLYNKDNQIIGLVGITHDITQHKQAEESLENERLLLRTVIDNIPDTIFANDLSGRKTLANAAEVNTLGFKSESDLLGKVDSDFYPPKLAEKFKLNDQKLLETGEPEFDREGFITDGKGEKRWVLSSKLPLRDKNNQIIGLVCIGRDITSRKKMEESLRQSEEHYRTLVERMPDGVYKSTHDGKFISVNSSMVMMLGYESVEELMAIDIKTQLYFVPEDRSSLVLENELKEMAIYRMKKKDGSEIWIEDHGWYVLDEKGEVLFHEGVMRDVTNRMQSEQALSESREELKKFAAHLQNVREEERLLLANEIHDELGQILIAIKIDMGILKQKTLKIIDKDKSKDILPKFDNIFGLIDNTINTTRKIMADNRHEELHLLGFIESAKLHTSNFQDKYQINCQFENAISKLEINPQQAIALFRILQEALNNVAEHAKATAVQVQLYAKDDKLILDIKDNGVGFTEKQEINKDAYGLIGMKERAFLLDGELKITSQPGKGTSVRVEMPYQVISE